MSSSPPRLMIEDLRERPTVSVKEAARALGIGQTMAYQLAREGKLPTVRLGRRILVPTPALLRMLGESAS